jgi:hypothetical protein
MSAMAYEFARVAAYPGTRPLFWPDFGFHQVPFSRLGLRGYMPRDLDPIANDGIGPRVRR